MAGGAFHNINAEELTIIDNIKPIISRSDMPGKQTDYPYYIFRLK
jgi:hypothetical protein